MSLKTKSRPLARKRFGQNYLLDHGVIHQIIAAIGPQCDDHIVEIGPGGAALTSQLVKAVNKMEAIEIDRDLFASLTKMFAENNNITLHLGDALRFDFQQLCTSEKPLRIVGNLPYNIATPLLFHLATHKDCIKDLHFMLQKEVAERLAAGPGSHQYGRLSVTMQYRFQIIRLFDVAPEAFSPVPKVDSAFVRLLPQPTPPVFVKNITTFEKIVAQAFAQRRKTLRNTLRDTLSKDDLQALGIDPSARAETLGLEEFAKMSNQVDMINAEEGKPPA